MTLKPISITLDQIYSNKIRVIQEAFSEHITCKMIVEELFYGGYATALKTLQSAGFISDSVLGQGIRKLPDYLRSSIDS